MHHVLTMCRNSYLRETAWTSKGRLSGIQNVQACTVQKKKLDRGRVREIKRKIKRERIKPSEESRNFIRRCKGRPQLCSWVQFGWSFARNHAHLISTWFSPTFISSFFYISLSYFLTLKVCPLKIKKIRDIVKVNKSATNKRKIFF